ncbi:MAG: hypothetical protein Q9217_005586 [Psora testacea]
MAKLLPKGPIIGQNYRSKPDVQTLFEMKFFENVKLLGDASGFRRPVVPEEVTTAIELKNCDKPQDGP